MVPTNAKMCCSHLARSAAAAAGTVPTRPREAKAAHVAIVPRYKVMVRSESPSVPCASQSSSASLTVYRRRGRSPTSSPLCSSLSLSRTSTLVLRVYRPDIPLPGFVPVDRVLAVTATLARGGRHDPRMSPWLPVWLPTACVRRSTQPLIRCARQDSNPRPAA
jgi:hypothetical protein